MHHMMRCVPAVPYLTASRVDLRTTCINPRLQDWGARIGAASGLRGFSTPPPPRKPFAVRGREPREGEDKQGRDRDSLKWGGRHNEEGDDWSDPNSFLGLLDDNDNFENPVWGNEFREVSCPSKKSANACKHRCTSARSG